MGVVCQRMAKKQINCGVNNPDKVIHTQVKPTSLRTYAKALQTAESNPNKIKFIHAESFLQGSKIT